MARTTFTLDEDATLAGPDVLVIVPKATRPVEEDQEVMIEGTVRPMIVAELERDYDWFDANAYDANLLGRFKERPVIVASSVRDQERGDVIAGAAKRPIAENAPANRPPMQ